MANIITGNGQGQGDEAFYMKLRNDRRVKVPAEAKTGDIHQAYLPWRIGLIGVMNEGGDYQPFTYYARADQPGKAGSMCAKQWLIWERGNWPEGNFPQLAEQGGVELIDEQSWKASLKEAKKYNLSVRYKGDPANPTIFTVIGHTDV